MFFIKIRNDNYLVTFQKRVKFISFQILEPSPTDQLKRSCKKKLTLLKKCQIRPDSAKNSLLVFSANLLMTTSASILARRSLSQAISKITRKLRTTRLILTRL